jgi:hypothetical protein
LAIINEATPANRHVEGPRVGGVEGRDAVERMIDDHRLEARRLSRDVGAVNTEPGVTAARASKRRRHEQIDLALRSWSKCRGAQPA